MRTFDFSPVFRSTVGFDRLARLADAAQRAQQQSAQPSYPPYNIEKLSDDGYRVTMAVAGFSEGDIDITVHDGTLIVAGKVEKADEPKTVEYLHRGIAERAFERRFELADFIKVRGAKLENGLLHVELAREVPEEKKPRKVSIGTGSMIEQKAA